MAKRIKQTGLGITEYIVIVVLTAVTAISIYQFIGKTAGNHKAAIKLGVTPKEGAESKNSVKTATEKTLTETDPKH